MEDKKIKKLLNDLKTSKSILQSALGNFVISAEKIFYAGHLLVRHLDNSDENKKEFLLFLRKLLHSIIQNDLRQSLKYIELLRVQTNILIINSLISQINGKVFLRALNNFSEKILKEVTQVPISAFLSDELVNDSENIELKTDKEFNALYTQTEVEIDSKSTQTRKSMKSKAKSAERRKKILDILSQKTKATATEISSQISDVSAKTIQRELNKLVEEGIIKKEGSKRWTVYSIV